MGKIANNLGVLGAAAMLSAAPIEQADAAESANPALANVRQRAAEESLLQKLNH